MRLLHHYYDTERPIGKETQTVSKRLRLYNQTVLRILAEFFFEQDDGWHNKRCDEEISWYQQKCVRNREVGKLGGRPRKTQVVSRKKRLETVTNPNQNQNQNHIKPSRSPNGSRLQLEVIPEDWINFASKERPDLDAKGVFENFRDFWVAKPGKDGMKLDWFATWRVWVRNQKAIGGGNGKGKFDPLAYSREQLRKSVAERMDAGITPEAIGSFPVEVHK